MLLVANNQSRFPVCSTCLCHPVPIPVSENKLAREERYHWTTKLLSKLVLYCKKWRRRVAEWNTGFERAALQNAVAVWQVLSEMGLLCQAQSEDKKLFKASSDTDIIGKPPRANWKSNSCLYAAGFHCFNIGPTIPNNTRTGNSCWEKNMLESSLGVSSKSKWMNLTYLCCCMSYFVLSFLVSSYFLIYFYFFFFFYFLFF